MELTQNNMDEGMLSVKSCRQWCVDAYSRPNPRQLWKSLWHEGEVCCLFADSNLGKSIYAVQIGYEISKSRKVLYFDFELSDKQFQLRYTDSELDKIVNFPDNFMRAEIDPDMMSQYADMGSFEDAIIENIESAALRYDCKTLIIDNLTYICNQSDKGDAAGRLMMNLMNLKKRYGWSILVIAHTPKRSLSSPITQNDLAGSKRLFNFFDSVFAIGKSARDNNLRYIKQLKVRSGAFEYDSDNVLLADIRKDDAMLYFHELGTACEKAHLAEPDDDDWKQVNDHIIELWNQGTMSQQAIANHLKISAGKVNKVIKAHRCS